MKKLICIILVCLGFQNAAMAAPRSLVEMTGFSYYLGCDPATPACWVRLNAAGMFYNILNIGANTKPVVVRDDLAEMNIITGGFTPQASGVYETRMLMEGVAPTAQSLLSCGWSTTSPPISGSTASSYQPPDSIVMIEGQVAGEWENTHMVPLFLPLTGGVTYYMTCWANVSYAFNNLTVLNRPVSPVTPIVDFIINKID